MRIAWRDLVAGLAGTRSVTGAKALAPRRYKLVRGAQGGLTSRSSLYNDYFLPSFFHTPLCVREVEKVPGQSNLRTTGGGRPGEAGAALVAARAFSRLPVGCRCASIRGNSVAKG